MCDEEDDLDILDDIKALEQALAQESLTIALDNEENDGDEEDEANDEDVEDNNEALVLINPSFEKINSSKVKCTKQKPKLDIKCDDLYDTIDSAIEANANLLAAYKSALTAVNARLDQCEKLWQEADYQVNLILRGGRANWRVPYFKAGQPYFKDENHFPATPNEDQLIKQKRDEFPIVYARLPGKWSAKGRTNLWNAARANASLKYLEKMKSMNRNNDHASVNYKIPSDFLHVLQTLGDTELDWMRISVKDMKNRYSWQACKAMWDLHMKPTNNREKWRNSEDNMLKSLAECYNYQNWNLIAEKLGTRRTCYQCFVRYNTLNPPSTSSINTDIPWSQMEDELLNELVEKLRIGDIIPWTLVTFYLGNRTKNQIYCHWKYNLDPTLKKGRFTIEEDQMLLNAANKYGKNFPRIAAEYFPHRTSVQLNTHFHLLMLKTDESYNSWTHAEDKQLLGLYDEFGNNWRVIGNIMNKDRTYVRHHHAALTRHLSKGIGLADVPRKKNTTTANDNDEMDDSDIEDRINENIDAQLIRYFQNIPNPVPAAGRKRKYHTAQQLENKTKQLRDVFKKLNVNFKIPDNLDDYEELTIMDKQLLISLKQSGGINSSNYTPDQIEQYRLKMFCTNKLDDNTEKFIPPAPFGLFQNVRKRGRSKKINADTVCDNCNVELVMEFETPENINKMLSVNELELFDKFKKIISQECKITQHPGRFEEKYMKSLKLIRQKSLDDSNPQEGTSTFIPTNEESMKKMNETFIEPCYSTLRGYQCLLNMQKLLNKPVSDIFLPEEIFNSEESKHAFYLLKNRFRVLFKYPIGMTRIPVSYQEINDNDNEVEKEEEMVVEEEDGAEEMTFNVPALEEDSFEMSPVSPNREPVESSAGDVEVSTPSRLSLNMVKTLRRKNKNKNNKLNIPNN
ncbi:hypothetical protein PV328_002521 [Microctonus aethiopoides]|uniref:Uncharacterized protein n=1 Tax=Microctonus aethiopoides TaxID=144406 RepID=A0AA39F6M6_9HYME|nr:hypothetical protein PV328_002521 [Microctonus aethiopoides]